jgi:hypothetical protein
MKPQYGAVLRWALRFHLPPFYAVSGCVIACVCVFALRRVLFVLCFGWNRLGSNLGCFVRKTALLFLRLLESQCALAQPELGGY